MVLADGAGAPLGIYVEAASPAEVTLLPDTLNQLADNVEAADLQGWPQRLIADRGYDSNPARKLLEECEIEPVIPARKNNRRATHQDGRKLRRYRKRWIIERTNAWLQNFRRIVVRYERKASNFEALVHLACALIIMKRVLG